MYGKTPRTLDVPGEGEFGAKGVSYCVTCLSPDSAIVINNSVKVDWKIVLIIVGFVAVVAVIYLHRARLMQLTKGYKYPPVTDQWNYLFKFFIY